MASVMLLLPNDKSTVTIKIGKNIQFIKYYECIWTIRYIISICKYQITFLSQI